MGIYRRPRRSAGEWSSPEPKRRRGRRTAERRRELRRGLVVQRRVRPTVVVVVLPPVADLLRLAQARKRFPAQLSAQPTVEALRVGVLPRTARLDVQRLHPRLREQRTDRLSDEPRTAPGVVSLRMYRGAPRISISSLSTSSASVALNERRTSTDSPSRVNSSSMISQGNARPRLSSGGGRE